MLPSKAAKPAAARNDIRNGTRNGSGSHQEFDREQGQEHYIASNFRPPFMNSDQTPQSQQSSPSFFERVGERVLLLLVGPLHRVPDLYLRGRWRFVTTRAAAYATVMTAGLALLNAIVRGPMFSSPLDIRLLLLRLSSYWAVQFAVGALLALFIWRMVARIAQIKAQRPIIRNIDD